MAKKAKGSGDKFLDCLLEGIEKVQGFGKTKVSLAKDEYLRQVEFNQENGQGLNDARIDAMTFVQTALEQTKLAKQNSIRATANKVSEANARFDEADTIRLPWLKNTPAVRAYHALRTMLEQDPRMKKTGEHNFVAEVEVAKNNMFRMLRDQIDEFSKNWLGQRRGSVTDADIADEIIRPGSTVSQVAKDIAKSLEEIGKYHNSELNLHGVTIKRLAGELPFHPIGAKLVNVPEFVSDIKQGIDWAKSGAGRYIRPAERDEFLEAYAKAVQRGDFNKFPDKFRPYEYTGGEFARDFHNDRFIQFKDGKSYADMVAKYMDGGMLQTTTHSIEKMAHNLGVVKIFGPSPSHTSKLFREMAADRAGDKAVAAGQPPSNRYLRRYQAMEDIALRRNPIDPESRLGQFVEGTGNMMTAAMLSQASWLSIPGDIATTMANRMANNEPILRIMSAWPEAFIRIKWSRREALAAGHASSEFTANSVASSRYGVMAEYGPWIPRYIADKAMRLNFMNRGFDAMRGADSRLRSMSLYEQRTLAFKDVRERVMLERNGITEAEWKRTTEVMEKHVYRPADDITMFRPMDHFDSLGSDLAHKWQRMFYNESRRSVIENTIEARAMMTGATRADTLTGAVLASFAKFHGYPTTFFLGMARAALATDTPLATTKMLARTGLMVTVAAAMGIQAKQFWQGKEFYDPRDVDFWMKASMSGGAFSMWGDFVTGAMRADSATTIVKGMAGPYAQMVGDAFEVTLGSAFQALEIGEHSGKWTAGKAGVELVDFMRKYMIPETFFVAPIMQRDILEPFQDWLSPDTMAHRYKSQKGFAAAAGTPFKPGMGPGSLNPLPIDLGS
jgi:hypothetical protein